MTIERASVDRLSLQANGESLSVERHSPDDLDATLRLIGREAIIHEIEMQHTKTLKRNPAAGIARVGVNALYVGHKKSNSLSSYGQLSRAGTYPHWLQARPEHREYWSVLEDHGFTPLMFRFAAKGADSYQLTLRNPETDPTPLTPIDHLPAALGFVEPAMTRELRPMLHNAAEHGTATSYQELFRRYSEESEQAVDRQAGPRDPWEYSCAQIGAGIAGALLRVETRGDEYLLDPEGYLQAIDELEEYAYRSGLEEISDELKKELQRIQALQV